MRGTLAVPFLTPRLVLVAAFLLTIVGLVTAQEAKPSVHAAAYAAVSRGQVEKTKMIGFSRARKAFDESNIKGGVLIGFDCGLSMFFDKEVVTALRPVYRTSAGNSYGREYGKFDMATTDKRGRRSEGIVRITKLRARPGYAVGGIRMRTGLGIDGLSLMYHKVEGPVLEVTPSFRSEWVGNTTGGGENSFTTSGQPVVGVFGNLNDDGKKVIALGFLHVQRATDSADVRAGVAARAAPALAPVEKPKDVVKAPEPAKEPEPIIDAPVVKQSAEHRDNDLHYAMDVPDGWRPFTKTELERINALLNGRHSAGFKPKDQKGNYPYVLIESQLTRHNAGLTLEQVEPIIEREVKSPAVPAGGTLGQLLANLIPDRAGLDRDRNRLVTQSRLDSPSAGKVRSVTVYHVGVQAIVSVQCCAKEETFDRYLPAFAQLNDTFAFDEGHGFRPPAPMEEPAESNKLLGNLLPLAVFAGVSGVILLPLMFMLGRKKPAPKKKDEDEDEDEAKEQDDKEDNAEPTHEQKDEERQQGTMQLATASLRAEQGSKIGGVGSPQYFTVKVGKRWTRIYVTSEALLVLDVGVGQTKQFAANGGSVGGMLGSMVGELIDEVVTHSNLHAMRSRMDLLDGASTEDLVRLAKSGGANYFMRLEKVKRVRVDVPSWWESLFGTAVGVLRVQHDRHGEVRFDFEQMNEMKLALELLPDVLGKRVAVNVVLDRRTWKYVKK